MTNKSQTAIIFSTPVLPVGYTVAQGGSLPEIYVLVGAANTLASPTGDFTVLGGSYNTSYRCANNTLTILSDAPLTITGKTVRDNIVVGDNVTAIVALDHVGITFQNGAVDEANPSNAGTTALALGSRVTLHLTLIGTSNLQSGVACICNRMRSV